MQASGREAGTSRRARRTSRQGLQEGRPCEARNRVVSSAGRAGGRIRRGEYVDFAELPPAMPDDCVMTVQSSEHLLIVQAADYRRTRRRVSDVTVWTRCHILFAGHGRARQTNGYLGLHGCYAAQKFTWPACEEYDRQFCRMVAGDEHRLQSRLDAGLYMECFTLQALMSSAVRDPARTVQMGQA